MISTGQFENEQKETKFGGNFKPLKMKITFELRRGGIMAAQTYVAPTELGFSKSETTNMPRLRRSELSPPGLQSNPLFFLFPSVQFFGL